MNESTSSNQANTSMNGGQVLVLAPDESLAAAIGAALREAAPEAHFDVARSLEEAQRMVVDRRPDLFVLDVDATYDLGQEFLYDLRTSHPHARAIILTAVHLAAHREQAAGLGAIHFLEKPFPHADFVDLVGALLQPGGQPEGEKFQGTLSDLHIADIIQLKCMSGTTSVLEFTGPQGEKARVFFENGQVRHATAPGKDGVAAFNEIVRWKGGMISEVSGAGPSPRTIELDWQLLLMEAVRKIDEAAGEENSAAPSTADRPAARKVLVIDDSVMLLSFVKEILAEANYQVVTAPTAEEGLSAAAAETPHLVLLDYVLPDMKGDQVLERLLQNSATAQVPVVYMSGFGADLPSDPKQNANVVGSLNKPFTSELLLQTVALHLPNQMDELGTEAAPEAVENFEEPDEQEIWASEELVQSVAEPEPAGAAEAEPFAQTAAPNEFSSTPGSVAQAAPNDDAWWSAAPSPTAWAPEPTPVEDNFISPPEEAAAEPAFQSNESLPPLNGGAYFCGDTSFFSLNWALHAIGSQKLTGTLRCFWDKEPVDLLARNGQIILVTTRDPELYCAEAPITLVNIEEEKTARAREQQRETGRPLFITLAQEGLVIREPAVQLVQHYGQKLFAQLWAAPRVRFFFEQAEDVPHYAQSIPANEDVDHWALETLRFIQFQDLGRVADYDPASIPAYTRDGFERVQHLKLTVAEAQFASQFNGVRSIAQIAKNLRLDLKFARLTLFRFRALEIVECWPPGAVGAKPEKRGVFGRIFGE
ncbi:MAG: response regulator [Chthoniobacterales bacterium]